MFRHDFRYGKGVAASRIGIGSMAIGRATVASAIGAWSMLISGVGRAMVAFAIDDFRRGKGGRSRSLAPFYEILNLGIASSRLWLEV
ncbi:hypothetical protein B296_00009931 [Ensete ventricosum]|uniref:Uncharacterized protein n=1 Tax=Ensete ventricosum TaxID=4639 RepID=A0A426ZXG4_ENSVE|nr:hypothetical protein B296_00009931 [Ensete ventricosum]